jgi:DNA gyrase subunit A
MLRRLVALERKELADELAGLRRQIAEYDRLLGSERRRRSVVAAELAQLAEEKGTPRRTRLVDAEDAPRLTAATAPRSLELGDDPCILTLSSSGLLGREVEEVSGAGVAASGARGRLGRHDVLVGELHTSNRTVVRAITERGRVLALTALEVPPVAGRSRGAAVAELFPVVAGERVVGLVGVPAGPLLVVSAAGFVKRWAAEEVASLRAGVNLVTLSPDDRLVAAFPASDDDDVLLVASDAQALRSAAANVPVQGRSARGVAGMKLRHGAHVDAAGVTTVDGVVVTVTDGDGLKVTASADVPRQGRATGGARLTRLRPEDGAVRLAVVSGVADLWCVMGRDDDPARPDTQPQPLPSGPTRRDGSSTRTARRILAVGPARW